MSRVIPPTTVYARSAWQNAWAEIKYLDLVQLTYGTGARPGMARFEYAYGQIMRRDSSTQVTFSAISLDKWFVRVDYTDEGGVSRNWYGVVINDQITYLGNNPVASGNQILVAYELSWVLSRKQILSDVISKSGEPEGQRIDRPIAFNWREGIASTDQRRGNRTTTQSGTPATYQFSTDFATSDLWSVPDSLDYLLKFHTPFDSAGPVLEVGNPTPFGQWYTPPIRTEGRTVLEVISQIVSEQRGMSWRFLPSGDESKILLWLDSYAVTDVTHGTPATTLLPANPTQIAITTAGDVSYQQVAIGQDFQKKYGQVRAVGARRRAVFTMGHARTFMEGTWSGAEETEYKSGDPSAAGTINKQKLAHDTYRLRDELRHVYTQFRLPDTWDGKINGTDPACPVIESNGDPSATEVVPFWLAGLRFDSTLPIRHGWTYSDPANPVEGSADAPFRKAFGIYHFDAPGGVRSFTNEQLRAASFDEQIKNQFTTMVFAEPDRPAMNSLPSDVPHSQGLTYFDPAVSPSNFQNPAIDWKSIEFTVICDWDEHVEAAYPSTPEKTFNSDDVLVLRLGSQYRLDWMAKDTIYDIGDDNVPKTSASGGFLRDDREKLEEIAKTAWAWYGRDRAVAQLVRQKIDDPIQVGGLITTIDGIPVNALCISITHDFQSGTTKLTTSIGKFNVRTLV